MASEDAPTEIWGPTRGFIFGELPGNAVRHGGGPAWLQRALMMSFFVEHDNQPTPRDEIEAWIDTMTPTQIRDAVDLAITIGLP